MDTMRVATRHQYTEMPRPPDIIARMNPEHGREVTPPKRPAGVAELVVLVCWGVTEADCEVADASSVITEVPCTTLL